MKKKGLTEVIVKTVMSLYQGSVTKVRLGSELPEEFWMQVRVHQESVLSAMLFGMAVDVITEIARMGWVSGSKDEVLTGIVDPCTKRSMRVMANLTMCTKCGK